MRKISKILENEDYRAESSIPSSSDQIKNIMIEFYFYVAMMQDKNKTFNKKTLVNLIRLSIHADLFLKTLEMSLPFVSSSDDSCLNSIYEEIFENLLLPFLDAFKELEIPCWNLNSANLIDSIKERTDQIINAKSMPLNQRAYLLFFAGMNFYSFLNNILLHISHRKENEDLLDLFDYKCRDNQFLEIIYRLPEESIINLVFFYYETKRCFTQKKINENSSSSSQRQNFIEELSTFSPDYLEKLKREFNLRTEKIKLCHDGLKKWILEEKLDFTTTVGFDCFYSKIKENYRDLLVSIEFFKICQSPQKEFYFQKFIHGLQKIFDLKRMLRVISSLETHIKNYEAEIKFLTKNIENFIEKNKDPSGCSN